jgi:hypothetical protein
MSENVGRLDRVIRGVLGPALIAGGYGLLGGRRGRCGGLLAMLAGALVTETALTRTCALYSLLGVDSKGWDEYWLLEPRAGRSPAGAAQGSGPPPL